MLNPNLAGGALLDLGIYPISIASFALGRPSVVTPVGTKASTGVDGQVSAIFTYAGGAHALINTTLFARTPTTLTISGTQARIQVPGPFYGPQPVTLLDNDDDSRVWDDNPVTGHTGFAYEIAEFARMVSAGERESELMPWSETVSILEPVDGIRQHIGVTLPGD